MIADIHHHLIHGVDDGPRDFSGTRAMLRVAEAEGIGHIIATAHAVPGREPFPMQAYLNHLDAARRWCEESQIPIAIHPGNEIMYTDEAPRLLNERKILPLANTNYVLVEFGVEDCFERLCHAARSLGNAGYKPILAHVERYRCLKKIERALELKETYEMELQINADTILKERGLFERRRIRALLEDGLIDYVASDAHDTRGRRASLGACRALIFERYGQAFTDRLFHGELARALEDFPRI